jgi:hypothetical protein
LSNGNFLRSPCAGKLAQAKELVAKFPGAMLGALEHCLKCGGKDLVIREAAQAATVKPDLTVQKEEQDMAGKTPEMCRLSPEKIAKTRAVVQRMAERYKAKEVTDGPAPRCPKHQAEPQVQCGPDSKRAGQYLGACKVCMAERKVGRKASTTKAKMTPAVARDLGIVTVPPPAPPEIPLVRQIDPVQPEIDVQPAPAPAPPAPPELACKKHPDRLAQIDALGRNMRLCPECVSERGRKSAEKNREQGVTGPPFSIPLNAGKWAYLKEWLVEQAEEYNRTLAEEVMYRLKIAMRMAVGRVDGQV